MNEKIKQLGERAGFYGVADDGDFYGEDVSDKKLQDFAELLIKECIDAINETLVTELTYTTYDKSMIEGTKQRCVKSIKDKFNIKYN